MKTTKTFISAGCMCMPGCEVEVIEDGLQIDGKKIDQVPVAILQSNDEELLHHELHPDFWTTPTPSDAVLKPEVRERLLELANQFYAETGFKAPIKDIILTGSLANYNYHDGSDLDTHVVIDFSQVNADNELAKNAANAMRWKWNEQHNVFIHGHEVELYIQDANEPHTASGVYSLMQDKWLVQPQYQYIRYDAQAVNDKADDLRRQYQALQAEYDANPDQATDELLSRIQDVRYKMLRLRRDAFDAGLSEFSTGNLAFKQLRNDGTIGAALKLEGEVFDKVNGI